MAQYDTSQIRALGNAWLNDSHNLRGYLQTMHESVWSMSGAWTGKAGTAAQVVWNGSQTGDHNIWNEIFQAAWVAEQIGNSILQYADELDKTVKEINKSHLIEALASIFGLILNGATLGLAGVIEELATKVGTLAAALAADSARFAGIAAALGNAAAFATSAGIWGFLTLKNDIFSQILASEIAKGPIKIDWAGEAMNLGLGLEAGLGEHFGPHLTRGDKQESVPKVSPGALGENVPNAVPHVSPTPTLSDKGSVTSWRSSTDTLVPPTGAKLTETGPATYGSEKFDAGHFVPDAAVKADASPGAKGDVGVPGPGAPRPDSGAPGGTAPLPGGARPDSEGGRPAPGSAPGTGPGSARPSNPASPAPGPGGPESGARPPAEGGHGDLPANAGRGDTAPAPVSGAGSGAGKPQVHLEPAPRSAQAGAHPAAAGAGTTVPSRPGGTGGTSGRGAAAHDSPTHGEVPPSPTGRPHADDAPILPSSSSASHTGSGSGSGSHTVTSHDDAPGPMRAAHSDAGAGDVRAADAGTNAGAGSGGARGAGDSPHGAGPVREAVRGADTAAPASAGRPAGLEPAGGARPGRGVPHDGGAAEAPAGGGNGRHEEPAPTSASSATERPAPDGHGSADATRFEASAAPGAHGGAGRGKDALATSASEAPAAGGHDAGATRTGPDAGEAGTVHDAGATGTGHGHGDVSATHAGAGAEPVRHDTAHAGEAAPDHGPEPVPAGHGSEQKAAQWGEFKREQVRNNTLLLHAETHLESLHTEVRAAWVRGADKFATLHRGKDGQESRPGAESMDEHWKRMNQEARWERAVKDAEYQWRADFTRQFRAELETNGRISTESYDRILRDADENAYRHLQRADQLITFADKFTEALKTYKANAFGNGDDLPAFDRPPADYAYDKELGTYVRDDAKVYGYPHEPEPARHPAGAAADGHTPNGHADAPVDFFRDKSHDFNALEHYYIDKREHLNDILDESLHDTRGADEIPPDMLGRVNRLLGESSTAFHIDRLLRDSSRDLDWIASREHDVRTATDDVTEDWWRNVGWETSRPHQVVDHVRADLARELRALHDEVFIHRAGHDAVFGNGDGQGPRRQWNLRTKHLVEQFPERIAKAEFVHAQMEAEKAHAQSQLWDHTADHALDHLGEDGEQRLIGGYLKQVRNAAELHSSRQQERGLKPGASSAGWNDVRDQLRAALPDRITHERDVQEVVSRSAHTFHTLVDRPSDITEATLHEDTISRLGNDFRTEHVTRFDDLYAPEGHSSEAWLAHESHHEDGFQGRLGDLRRDEAATSPAPAGGPAAEDAHTSPAAAHETGTPADPASSHQAPAAPQRPDGPAGAARPQHGSGNIAASADDAAAHPTPPREHSSVQTQLEHGGPTSTHQRPGRSPARPTGGTTTDHTPQEHEPAGAEATVERDAAGSPGTMTHSTDLTAHVQETGTAGRTGATDHAPVPERDALTVSEPAASGPSDLYGEVHRGLPQDGFTFSRTQVHRTYEDLLEQRPAVAAMPIEAKAAHVADALTASAAQVVEAATGPLQQLTGRYFYGPEIHRVHQQLLGQRGDAFLLLPPEKRAEHVVAEVVDSAKLLSDVRERLHQSEVGPGHVSYVRDQLVRTHGEAFALWRPEVRADAAAEAVRQQTTLTRGVNAWLRERPYVRLWGADYRQVDRAYQDLVAEHGRPFTALGTGRQAAAVGVRIIQAQPSLMEAEGTRALVAGVDVPRMIAEAGAEDVRSPAAAEAGTEQDVRPGLDQVRRRLESARTEFRFTDAQIGHAYEELLVRRPAAAGLPADAKAAQVAESLVLSARRLVRAASGPLLRHSGLYPDEREVYQVHQELLQRRGDRFLRLSPEERAEHVVAEMVDRQELSRAVKDLLRQPSLPAAHVAYAHEQIVRAYGPGVTRLSVGERAEFVAQIVRQQRELTRGVDEWLRQRPGVRLWGADHREVDQAYQDLVAEHGRAFAALDTGRQVAAVGARILRNAPLASLPETTGARGAGVDAHAAPGVEVGAPADADAALSAGAGADVRRTIADAGAQDVRSPAAAEAAAQGLRPRSGPVRPWQLSPEERNGNAVAELVDRRQLLHGVREHLGDDRVTAAHVSYAYALILHIHGPEFTRLDIGHRAEFVAQVVRAHLTFTGDAHPAAEAQVREDPPAAVTAFEQDRPRPATDGLDQREAAESAKQKAVTVPPEPARRPVDTPSGFAGITVRWDREADPHFLSTVQEQLRLLASKPAGKALLDQIAAAAATSKLAAWQDVKVKIERIGGGTAIGQDAGFHAHAGNVTKAINSEWATRTGKGTLSLVRYNPNAWETPDGLRPPFIGLVHELIHVHRNLRGTSHPSAAVDEAQVVGFGEYADLEFTENKIREEHGLPPRRTYAGTVGPDLDDAHLPRTTGRTGPRRAGRGTTRGTGGYGTAGLLRNAGAGERELELSEKHGVRIGPSKRLSGGGHFSHSELDRIDAALGGLPAEHLRGNPDLQYIEPAAGSGDGASAYDRETRGIGMVRPAAVPSWLYTGLDRGSRAQRFVMDRLALSGYDGVPVADVLGFAGGRRNVMGGVSNVLANGNLLEWTVRHEVGHSVAEHRAWFWALRQQTAFGGWRVHTPVDGRVDEVADDVLRMADLEDKADVPDDEGRTLADVLARELVPSRLRDEPERLAGLARSFPGADEALRAGLERVVTFARVALAQPWTLDDGGAATQTIGLRVYHIDQEGSWVSYLRRERERHAVSNYQFSTPDEWFAEAYAAYFDPLPGPRERLHPVVREWFEEGLPQLLADERAPGTAGAVPMTPLSPAPPSAAPASAGAAAEPLAWAAMNIGGRLYTSPEGVSIRVRGPRRSGKDGRTPNQLADAAWQKLPEGTRQGLRKERLDLSVDPLTLAETDPALHQGLSNAGRSLEGGSIGSTAARNAVLEALGKRDPATRGAYWKGQDERDTVLGMVAREEQRVFRGRLPTRHTREQEAARAIDGASPVEALRRLLGGHEGVVIGEEHEGTAVQGLLAGHLADLKAAGVRTVYLGGVRGDSYQRHLDAYLASGTMPPELQSLTRHFDGAAASPHSAASAHSAGQGMRDLLRAARQHGVRIVGVDGRPARATGDATDAGAGFRRGAALNTYAAGLVRRDQRAAADGGGYLVVVGAGHTGAFPGPERQIELHGQKFRPGTEFPGIDDLLDVPRVVVDRDGALHPGPRSGRSGTDTDQARPDTAAVAGARPGAHADVDGTGLMAQVLDAHGDPRHDLLDAAAAAVEREERYGWVSRVNPYRDQGGEFRTNCVLAAIAVDTSLAEHAVFQAPGSDLGEPGRGLDGDGSGLRNYLGRYRDLEPYPVDGPATVVEAMTRAEPGQRGMVVVEGPGGRIAHVVNVVRDDHGVVFLDGQAGTLAPAPGTAVSFLPTTHGVPGFPLDQEARAAAPAIRPVPLGAVGTETEFQFPLALDEYGRERHAVLDDKDTLAYWTRLTRAQIDALDDAQKVGIPQIKVDTTTVFRGVGGAAALSDAQIRRLTGRPSTGRSDIKIPELVLPPMRALGGEDARFAPRTGLDLHASVQNGLARAHTASGPVPLSEALGDGWTVTDMGESVLVGRAPTGRQHPAYTQFTVGVPVAGLSTMLQLVEERLPSEFSDFAPVLAQGRLFADAVTRSYARRVLGSVRTEHFPFLGGIAGLEDLHGYAWLLFNHVASGPVAEHYLGTVPKIVVPALSRVSFGDIRKQLPPDVRAFLRDRAARTEKRFSEHLDTLLGTYAVSRAAERVTAEGLLTRRFASGTDVTLGDYLLSGLTGRTRDGRKVGQADVFRIHDFGLDTTLSSPLVLLELRNFGKGLTSQGEMRAHLDELTRWSAYTWTLESRTWPGAPAEIADRVLADPLVTSLTRVLGAATALGRHGVATFRLTDIGYVAREAAAAAGLVGTAAPGIETILAGWEQDLADRLHWQPSPGTAPVPAGLRPLYQALLDAVHEARGTLQSGLPPQAGTSRRLGASRVGAASPVGDALDTPPAVRDADIPGAFGVPVVSAGASLEVWQRYAWVERVNPYRDEDAAFRTNCVLAAIAVDMSLADPDAAVFQAPPSGLGSDGLGQGDDDGLTIHLGRYRDLEPYPVHGPAEVVEAMSRAEPGRRGMVVVEDGGGGIAHVVNVARDVDGVVFLDGQAGTLVPPPAGAVSFLPTTHGIPGFPPHPRTETAADDPVAYRLGSGRPDRARPPRTADRPTAQGQHTQHTQHTAGSLSRAVTRGAGGRGAAGLLWNAGAVERERELSARYGVRIGPAGRSASGHFSHSVLDRIDEVLGGLPSSHVRGNRDLWAIRRAGGSGTSASAYHSTTRSIDMVRPWGIPTWLHSELNRGSRWQRFLMDRGALSDYDGVSLVRDVALGIGGRRRHVMGGVSDVLAHGNLLKWTIRHEVGHSLEAHRGFTETVMSREAFGGWRVHRPLDGRVEEVADAVLRRAGIEDLARLPDRRGRTLAGVLAETLVPSALRAGTRQLADLARTFPAADERLTGALGRIVTFARLALAQPWMLDDGGAATLAVGERVYHVDQEGTWVSYLRAQRELHAVSNYHFSTPGEGFAETYAAYFDPAPGPRARLHPGVGEWFEHELPDLLAFEQHVPADSSDALSGDEAWGEAATPGEAPPVTGDTAAALDADPAELFDGPDGPVRVRAWHEMRDAREHLDALAAGSGSHAGPSSAADGDARLRRAEGRLREAVDRLDALGVHDIAATEYRLSELGIQHLPAERPFGGLASRPLGSGYAAGSSSSARALPGGRPLGYRERVALAKRVWRRPVAEEVPDLERTLLEAGPASRSLVMGVTPGQHLWAVNVGGTILWFEATGRTTEAPGSAEGEVVSIDLDGTATLIHVPPRLLQAGGGGARFCEISLGADPKHLA